MYIDKQIFFCAVLDFRIFFCHFPTPPVAMQANQQQTVQTQIQGELDGYRISGHGQSHAIYVSDVNGVLQLHGDRFALGDITVHELSYNKTLDFMTKRMECRAYDGVGNLDDTKRAEAELLDAQTNICAPSSMAVGWSEESVSRLRKQLAFIYPLLINLPEDCSQDTITALHKKHSVNGRIFWCYATWFKATKIDV